MINGFSPQVFLSDLSLLPGTFDTTLSQHAEYDSAVYEPEKILVVENGMHLCLINKRMLNSGRRHRGEGHRSCAHD